jgi:iron complex outermembrane receptor protein
MFSGISRHATIAALYSGVALLALAGAHPAYAADAAAADDAVPDTGNEPIIVTARRVQEKIQDVPIAISVVSERTLEKTGNYTLGQITQQVPSLQVAGSNPRNTAVTIRGLGANSSIAVDGLEYGVGFYVDGVYYGRPAQSQFDLVDLQQVEVLRGPQGTLFGKNTTAGAINITTREPSFTPELTAEGQVGNYNYYQVRGSASLPIIDDKVAVRLSVADTHRDGFLTNAYDGSDAQNYNNLTLRGQLLIKPAENLKIRIIGDYSHQTQHYSLALVSGYFTTFANGVPIPNNIFQRAARLNYTLPSPNAFNRVGNADAPFFAKMKSYGASGQVDWDIGPATITSVTAYRWWDWNPANDVDGTSLPINLKGAQSDLQRQFSQELRIASNGTHKIDYVAGLYYFWQVVNGYTQTQYGSDFAAWNLNPATTPASTIAVTSLALTNYEADGFSNPSTKSYAAFGQANWHIADPLTLTVGLRFTHEDKHGIFTRSPVTTSGLDLSGQSAATLAAVQAIRSAAAFQLAPLTFSANSSSNALTGLASLTYKITRDVMVYGSYSRGNQSGGLNLTAGGLTQPVVNPEKVDAFEVGLKSQFLHQTITANVAAFLTNVYNFQANVSIPIPGSTATIQYISNIPEVRSKGIEGDLAFTPVPGITFSSSLAYTDARYVSYTNAPQRPELGGAGFQDLSGVRLPGVSKFAYTLVADASRPIDDHTDVYTRVDWVHRSSFNTSTTNSIYSNIPAYGILSAKVGLRIQDGKFDLSVWGRNLLNKNYFVNLAAGTFGLINGAPGDPRTYGVTARVKY